VHSLITLGGQHQGVANTPGCSVDLTGAAAKACTAMQLLLARGAYAPWVRDNIVQAQYFKVWRGGHVQAWLLCFLLHLDVNSILNNLM
jgi:hypothetical protein